MTLGWSRERRRRAADDPPEPVNLRLVLEDGTGRVIRCGVLREPSYDVDDAPTWLVVPLDGSLGPLGRLRGGFRLEADEQPTIARFILDFGAGRGPDDYL